MTVTKAQVQKILATLPIGYYAKRDIAVNLVDDASSSYYMPNDDKIIISYSQLSNALAVLPDTADPDRIENDVRTMLYHEVSHAILTPRLMHPNYQRNVVEDERIETLLKKFYLNVDFKDFVKRINHFKGEKPDNADDAFYQLVRYRIGSDYWLKRLHDLLFTYSKINSNSYPIGYSMAIDAFYNDFIRDYNSKSSDSISIPDDSKDSSSDDSGCSDDETDSELSKDASDSSDSDSKDSDSKDSDSKDSDSDAKDSDSESSSSISDDEAKGSPEDSDKDIDEDICAMAEEMFTSSINVMVNKDMIQKVHEVFTKATSSTKRNGSSINAYSGVFDPRSVIRDDYKYFTQKNRMGHLKNHSKIHLNLFIDRSGSFRKSQKTVNQLLFALKSLEKINPDFSFDLVTIGMGEILHCKNDRVLDCSGGNKVTKKIWDIVKHLQTPSATNYNIVLFDGDAFSDSRFAYEDEKNFGAFNRANFMIISDRSNTFAIETYCPCAKSIITRNYAQMLEENVFKALNQLVR